MALRSFALEQARKVEKTQSAHFPFCLLSTGQLAKVARGKVSTPRCVECRTVSLACDSASFPQLSSKCYWGEKGEALAVHPSHLEEAGGVAQWEYQGRGSLMEWIT